MMINGDLVVLQKKVPGTLLSFIVVFLRQNEGVGHNTFVRFWFASEENKSRKYLDSFSDRIGMFYC